MRRLQLKASISVMEREKRRLLSPRLGSVGAIPEEGIGYRAIRELGIS
jgi:hypothetical protein